jgi:zinc protease
LIRFLTKLTLLVCLSAAAQAEQPQVEEFTLSNGMPVVLLPNDRVPAVSHTLWLRVGAADDPQGASGLAHYHEHLMFKGTLTYPEGEYEARVEAMGGETNAFTGADYTGYYVNIATEHLEEVMQLEADRMQHLRPLPEHYAKEREVIVEERRMRIENQPAALLAEQMNAALYQHHPYQTPIIGWMHEMQELSAADAQDFYTQYYHAGNMLLVVAGDIDRAALQALAERYYGSIPARPAYRRDWVQEPPQRAARHVSLRHAQVQQAQFKRYYLVPSHTTAVDADGPEHAMALALLAQWLGGGDTGMLYQKLVREQGVAVGASAGYSGLSAGPAEFVISVTPATGVSPQTIEEKVDAVLAEALRQPVAKDELERIRTLFKADAIYAREGLQSLAWYAGTLLALGLPMDYLTDWEERVDAVDEDAVAAALAVLHPQASVTGYLLPEEAP